MKIFLLSSICMLSVSLTFSQDYWAMVPATPGGCYTSKDEFDKTLYDAHTKLKEQIEQRGNALKKQAENMTQEQQMKIATMYQSMTPQQIVQMQQEQQDILKLQETLSTSAASIEAKFNNLESKYREEYKSRLDPIWAEHAKLPDGEGTPDWAIQKGKELSIRYNKEYEELCKKYFTGSAALFPAWSAEYKKHLIDEFIPFTQKYSEIQYKNVGITPDPDLPVMEGVGNYMDRLNTIYDMRQAEPQGE